MKKLKKLRIFIKKRFRVFYANILALVVIVLCLKYKEYLFAFLFVIGFLVALTLAIEFFQDESNFEEMDEE